MQTRSPKAPRFTVSFDAADKSGGYRGSYRAVIGDWTSMPYADERSAGSAAKVELRRRDNAAVRASRGY